MNIGHAATFCLFAAPLLAQFNDYPGDVPYVPTPNEVVEAMLKLGGVSSADRLYDLGCGDGRIVVTAAQKFGARATGIDINPDRIAEANANARNAGVADKVAFIEKNLFDADVRDATVVTLYLLPDVNLRLRPILLKQLPNGARIVSHAFTMDDWQPEKTVEIGTRRIFLWTVTDEARRRFGPPQESVKPDGEWTFTMPTPNGDVDARLVLKSDGSRLTGMFYFPEDRRLEILDGTVDGSTLKFTVKRKRPQGGEMIYSLTGVVKGDRIEGSTQAGVDGQAVNQKWSAKRN